jgi:hypothetical protein
MRIVTSHVRPEARYWKTLGRLNANVRDGREDQASKERDTAAALMCGLGGSGNRAPITLSQFTCKQLQRHVVTDPGCSRIVAGTFVAKKRVCGVELMPLEVRFGITQRVVDQRPPLAGNVWGPACPRSSASPP